jgi:hypothetical protein
LGSLSRVAHEFAVRVQHELLSWQRSIWGSLNCVRRKLSG